MTATTAHGRAATPPSTGGKRLAAINSHLAEPSRLTPADADHLAEVAAELRVLFGAADRVHAAASRLNDVLIRHRAVPNLHGDPPVLAFHSPDATRAEAWTADMATALAMVIGVGQSARLGLCQAGNCSLVFFDTTRNASRRFCDLSCQNRAKASAYRARRAGRAEDATQ
ncbi:MAG: CGNR zinc finger domain-containing protein [Nonomuraea sp.]|nr:CGNR zinc finger domain-containing protein [Nonomuraea sp.]